MVENNVIKEVTESVVNDQQPESAPPTIKSSDEPSCFGEWCQMTGWHGILDFYNAKEIGIKIGWLLIVSIGLVLAIKQSATLISDFVSTSQWTTSIIYETSKDFEWPNLMICGLAWPGAKYFKISVPKNDFDAMSTMLGRNEEENENSANMYRNFEGGYNGVENIYSKLASAITSDRFNQTEYDSNICDKVLIHCGPMLDFDLKKETDCCKDASARHPQTACFQTNSTSAFNAGKDQIKTRMKSGAYYLINPKLNDYYGNVLYPGVGVRVQLFLGRPDIADNHKPSFALTPGTHNVVAMTKDVRRTVRRDRTFSFYYPTSSCDYTFKYIDTDIYTSNLCTYDCSIQWQLDFCQCHYALAYAPPTKGLDKYRACNKTEEMLCTRRLSDAVRFSNTPEGSSLNKCRDECPETCDFEAIDAKISSSLFLAPDKVQFFTKYFNKAMFKRRSGTNFTEDQVRQLIVLEMYYETRQNRVVETRERISIEELLSNIGGLMGVWSGISLISIVQIFFYIFQCVRKRAHKPTFLNERWAIKSKKVASL